MSTAEDIFEERRRRRRAGYPRLTDADREILRRITTGDLADAFADALEEISDTDPLLSGRPDD